MNIAADRYFDTIFTTTSNNPNGKYVVIMPQTNTAKCIGEHQWTLASGETEIPEGHPCDCGLVKYPKIEVCPICGTSYINNPKK
jgi:hypothetical protein